MKKRIIPERLVVTEEMTSNWLDLEVFSEVEITSEDPDYPIENALLHGESGGWRAAEPGKQTVRLLFHQPQNLNRVQLSFLETTAARTQQYVLRWSLDNGLTFNEIVRQQWNFSPEGSTVETEDHTTALVGVSMLELEIRPDISGQIAIATLEKLRVA